jgi:drug/metabolite transporter (DMT)-like permease
MSSQSEQTHKADQVFPLSGFLFAIAGTALFSLKSIFIKLAFAEGIDSTTLLALRMLIAFPFYITILIYAVKTRPAKAATFTRRDGIVIVTLGFFGYYLASYLDFEGLRHVSAQLERLILFTYPIMVALLSWVFFREKITLKILLSMIVSYLGVSFLFYSEVTANNDNVAAGTVLVALAALSFSIYVIFSKSYISRLGSLIFTSIAMSSALLFVLIQFFTTHQISDLNVSARLWFIAALIAIFSTLIPSFFTSEAINRIGATRMSITGSIGPVITIFLAVVLLDENFGWHQVAGLLLVLAGVSLLRVK